MSYYYYSFEFSPDENNPDDWTAVGKAASPEIAAVMVADEHDLSYGDHLLVSIIDQEADITRWSVTPDGSGGFITEPG